MPPTLQMASALATSDAQGSTLYDDLAVYFSQEECVSLHPAQEIKKEIKEECFEDVALMERSSAIPGRQL